MESHFIVSSGRSTYRKKSMISYVQGTSTIKNGHSDRAILGCCQGENPLFTRDFSIPFYFIFALFEARKIKVL